jgi:HK97 gp10 family phage protein
MAVQGQIFTGKLHGLEQTIKNLNSLGSTKARAVSRRALTSASSEPLKVAKQLVTKDTGQLKKSLGKKTKTYRNSGTTVVIIGPRVGFMDASTGRNPVKYGHLVELGTKRARAKPFLRPALAQTKDSVIRNYSVKLWDGIRREVERMKK